MASNKKSSLTGYLPDILMAAAAVRPQLHYPPLHSYYHSLEYSLINTLQPLIAYFVIRSLLTRLDPEHQQKEEARAKASAATRKLDAILTSKRRNKGDYDEYDSEDEETDSRRERPRIQDLNLNTYEQTIAMEVVAPEEIPVSFEGM
jgi:hypothetical protein